MNTQMQVLSDFLACSEVASRDDNKTRQTHLINEIIAYTIKSVSYYKSFAHKIFPHEWPILSRELIQQAGASLYSTSLPQAHGQVYPLETSGSTGKPVRILATDFTKLFYDALMLREHRWYQRDFSKTIMTIKWAKRTFAEAPQGHFQSSWGPPINQYYSTGNSIFINVASPTYQQIEALLHYQPQILHSYPSQLAALAEYCLNHSILLPFLEELRTTGETFAEHYKCIIKEAWPQVKLSDVYSCVEIGNIAQQCPELGSYHVNSEHVYLEIVDENNQPCELYQPGRVLLTSLLNFASPLIRYEVGDYAMWGKCDCGRTLPVIKQILGRKRNRLRYPNGESCFPYLGEREERKKIVSTVRKFQYIQHTLDEIECKLVLDAPLTSLQEAQYKEFVQKSLGYPFNVFMTYVEDIPCGPTGKFEEFISF